MKKVLIISPRFPPKNAPDHHRVRTSLPYFRQNGWEPTVLCLTPETSDGINDPNLELSVDTDIRVVRVAAWSESMCRKFGFGHIDYRCLWPLYQAGRQLLKAEKFDVVFFSTTVFLTFILGRFWKWNFKNAIVFDFQDPWVNENAGYTKKTAPGGWAKYRISQKIANFFEPFALRAADHVISVSEGYNRDLNRRYPWLHATQFSVIPFGAAQRDFELTKSAGIQQKIFQRADGIRHWVYVGRGGPDMEPALSALFAALAKWKSTNPLMATKLKLHFVGTNYSPVHRTFKVVQPLADRFGLSDLVEEHPSRVPYFEALALMVESDAVLLVGSISADYTASKLFNCVMSGKPILAIFHENSLVSRIARDFPNIFLASFNKDATEPGFVARTSQGIKWILSQSLIAHGWESLLTPHTAENLTKKICEIFEKLSARKKNSP